MNLMRLAILGIGGLLVVVVAFTAIAGQPQKPTGTDERSFSIQ